MANERRPNKSAARTPRHASSTAGATTTTTAGSSNNSSGLSSGGSSSSSSVAAAGGGKKQSRQYRLPHPPVPHAQPSLLQQSQRVPASVIAYPSAQQAGYEPPRASDRRYYAPGGRGGGLTAAPAAAAAATASAGSLPMPAAAAAAAAAPAPGPPDGAPEAAVPSADPDMMEAKKGLNKWGAFDSLSGSGTGTFGFGPLLFHHVDETPRDPYDTTNMMLNDPISFNPMSAISWARLDESPASTGELEADRSSAGQQPDGTVAAASGAASSSGSSGSSRNDGASGRARYADSPASTTASPRHGSTASYASDVSDSRTSSVAGSSVGNMSRTLSDTSLVSPDAERSTAGPPPIFASPSTSRAPHPLAGQQQQQKQQPGRRAEGTVQYGARQPQQQQQPQPQQAYPTQQPPSSRSPISHRATPSHQPYYTGQAYAPTPPTRSQQRTQRSSQHHEQQSSQSRPQPPPPPPPPQQQQLLQGPAATLLPPPQSLPPPQPLPAPQSFPAPQVPPEAATTATTDLLLCLAPHCSARFLTEQELAAHYRAEHAFRCTWASCSAASFTSSMALNWHINAEHLLICPMPACCGASFGSKRALDGHIRGEYVTSSNSTPSGSLSPAAPRKHPQQPHPQQPQQQQPQQQQNHHRARRRSKSPSFSSGHRPPQRARR